MDSAWIKHGWCMGNAFILRCRGMANAWRVHGSGMESVWGIYEEVPPHTRQFPYVKIT